MGLLTFGLNVTLDGCIDHAQGIVDDELHDYWTQLMDQSRAMLFCGCMRRVAKVAIGLELLLGIGALGGGIARMARPNGEILPLPVSALGRSPFTTYFVPGVILCFVLRLGPLCAAALAWPQRGGAPFLTFAVGCALAIWIAIELTIVGHSNHPRLPLISLMLGGAITLVGVDWLRTVDRR